MAFTNPLLLIGLSAILIPIIIHLFNFRRYKTVFFSNVKMLEDIRKKTRRESQLQQLIVLSLRILGIVALVFAFAQPYIPSENQKNKNGNLVTIFVDNSSSMEANSKGGSILYDAVDIAKAIVNAFSYNDDFVLTTQDFSGEESHLMNKDEMLELLDKVQISPNSHTFDDILAFENNTCINSHKENVVHYYLSDFQKNNFKISSLKTDKKSNDFLIPMPTQESNNVGVDSCWFMSPVFKVGKEVVLMARIHNYGKTDINKLPVKLYINDKQKAIAAIDLKAGSYTDCRLNYNIETSGTQCGRLVIEDAPITFDDQLFFTYEVTENAHIVAIDNVPNRFLNALYGKDSVFTYETMNYNQVNYSTLKNCQVVIMSEVPKVSDGMADELTKFVNSGGTLLVLPAQDMDISSWNSFLSNLGAGTYGSLNTKEMKCGSINTESVFFKGAIEKTDEHLDMPTVLKYFSINSGSRQGSEAVMTLENGEPLLNAYNAGKGKVLLCAVPMNDDFGNTHRHALFFVPMHNIGIMSVMQTRLYNTIGVDEMQSLPIRNDNSDNLFNLKARTGNNEFIPEQRSLGNETALYFHNQVHESGFYDIVKDGTKYGTLAFNRDRKESDLNCYDKDELKRMARASDNNVEVISADTKNMTKSVTDKLNGEVLWPLFVILSLVFFLAEICLLRYWGKPKLNKEIPNNQI